MQRPRVAASGTGSASEKSKARKDSAREILATANRAKWEQNNARRAELSGKKPFTNVYLASNFDQPGLRFSEALFALREASQTDMYDCMENPLHAKFVLNMQTKKKTKFIQKFEAHVVLPHPLNFIPRPRVLALCKGSDDAQSALEQGALEAGGEELFGRLEHGAFHWEEYDFVVAHSDWSNTISKLRHVLKDRLPTSKNARIGDDVSALVSKFVNGVSMESTRLEGVPEVNNLDVIVGQLCWEDNALMDNMRCYFDTIESEKSSRVVGNAIESVRLSCPPTGEQFLLDLSPFMEQLKPVMRDNESVEEEALEEATTA